MKATQKLEIFIEYLKSFAVATEDAGITNYGISLNSSKQKTVRKNGRFFKQDRYFTFTFDFTEYERGNSIYLKLQKQLAANEKMEKAEAFKSFKNFSDLKEENAIKIFECLEKYLFIKGTYKEDFENFLNKKELYLKLDNLIETKPKNKIVKI